MTYPGCSHLLPSPDFFTKIQNLLKTDSFFFQEQRYEVMALGYKLCGMLSDNYRTAPLFRKNTKQK